MATNPYEDDEVSTPSGRTQMSDPYEDRDQANLARAIAEGMKNSGGDARSAEEAGQFGEAGTSRVVKPSKSNIVTKEQLAKSGYDNLRDYMNAQQGLNRRKDSSEFKEIPTLQKTEPTTPAVAKPKPAAEMAKTKTNMTLTPANTESRRKFSEGVGKVASGATSGVMDYFKSLETPSSRQTKERKLEKRKADPTSRERDFAKGGKVSASSRGDGIAQRGKTRGKMC